MQRRNERISINTSFNNNPRYSPRNINGKSYNKLILLGIINLIVIFTLIYKIYLDDVILKETNEHLAKTELHINDVYIPQSRELQKLLIEHKELIARYDLLVEHKNEFIESSNNLKLTNDDNEPYLVIGIPTVPRISPNKVKKSDYLTPTIDAILNQLPKDPESPLYNRIKIVIVQSLPEVDHESFSRNKERLKDHPDFVFISEIREPLKDPMDGREDKGTANKPGWLVRRQTRHVAQALKVSWNLFKPHYYLFMEDDFQLCNYGLLAFQYIINKANLYFTKDWLAIRTSFGLNGVFIHGRDMIPFSDYLQENQIRRPPDHLLVEWFAGEKPDSKIYKGNRINGAFKYNIFHHLGVTSTLRNTKSTTYPLCWELLTEPILFEVEAFNAKQCPNDDLWPCNGNHIDDNNDKLLPWGNLAEKSQININRK